MSNPHLITMDWGTSSWRGVLWDRAGQVLEERSAPQGILQVAPGEFAQAWQTLAGDWIQRGVRCCLMSGMVGSRQGWVEVPYLTCPATFESLAAQVTWLHHEELPVPVGIVAGLTTEQDGLPDVMRGEETQIFGAAQLLNLQSATLVLPGTHSKWAQLEHGAITGFRSFMTGEVYALLRQHSILARLMPKIEEDTLVEEAFVQGLRNAQKGPLLSVLFSARTLGLIDRIDQIDRMAPQALPSYLSGMLIGHEMSQLAEVVRRADSPLVVVGTAALVLRYRLAAKEFGHECIEPHGNAAAVGLWRLASLLKL